MGIEQVKKSALRKKLVSTLEKKSNVFLIFRACATQYKIKKKKVKEKLMHFTENAIFKVLTPIIIK